jgi:hypothetical protein
VNITFTPMEQEVVVPDGTGSGDELVVDVEGLKYLVSVPSGLSAGETFFVTLPQSPPLSLAPTTDLSPSLAAPTVEVIVPDECSAGELFVVTVETSQGPVDFEVRVPDGCSCGSRLLVEVPPHYAAGPAVPSTPPLIGSCEAQARSVGSPNLHALSTPSSFDMRPSSPPHELSGSESSADESRPTFPLGAPAEVLRTDGMWTLVTVVDHDQHGNTYTVRLADGRLKYFVEANDLRLPRFMLQKSADI